MNIPETTAIKYFLAISHLTQCVFLHYLGTKEPTKYYFFVQCGMITQIFL